MTTEESMASPLEQMDAELARLRESLAGTDEAVLAQRPPSGKWSVHENVRHLVFAELAHNSHVLPGGREWSAIVLPPHDVRIQLRQKIGRRRDDHCRRDAGGMGAAAWKGSSSADGA